MVDAFLDRGLSAFGCIEFSVDYVIDSSAGSLLEGEKNFVGEFLISWAGGHPQMTSRV